MAVVVTPLNILGSSNPFITPGSVQRTFTDNFTRANNGGNWGNAWGDFNVANSTANAAALCSIVANHGQIVGNAGNTVAKVLIPVSLMWISQAQHSQFSEQTISTLPGIAYGVGPIVVCCPTMGSGSINQGFYFMQWNNTNIQIARFNWNGGNQTAVTLTTVAVTIANGDVMRLEAALQSNGNWNLTAKKNGTSVATVVNDGGLIQGCPGIYIALSSAGVLTAQYSEYAGGLL